MQLHRRDAAALWQTLCILVTRNNSDINLAVASWASVNASSESLQPDGRWRGELLGVMWAYNRFSDTAYFSLLILCVALLTRCRNSSAQNLSFQSGISPADSRAVQTIYDRHQAAQVEVVGRIGPEPDLRKLVCASTSLAGFATKNSSIFLTPTLKTRNALSGFKDVGVPIYDTCQVRSRPSCDLLPYASCQVYGFHARLEAPVWLSQCATDATFSNHVEQLPQARFPVSL